MQSMTIDSNRIWCFHAIEIDAISRETHVSFEVKLKALTIVLDSAYGPTCSSTLGQATLRYTHVICHRGK